MTAAALDPAGLQARATELAQYIRTSAADWGLTPADVAADLLNISPGSVVEAMTAGALDGLIVGGQAYVVAEQVHLQVLDEATTGAARRTQRRTVTRAALRAFLAEHPVVALWDEAVGDHRPLVCARRGSRFTHFGLQYHSVVLKARWLVEWVARQDVRERHPEISALPLGDELVAALAELPGVSAARFATPLAEQGQGRPQSHRMSGWVRIDPQVWPVQGVTGWLADLVNGVPE